MKTTGLNNNTNKCNIKLLVIVHTIIIFKQLLIDECIGTMFIMTPIKANFVESRGMCLSLGGDIVMESMGEEGIKHHRYNKKVFKFCYIFTNVYKIKHLV